MKGNFQVAQATTNGIVKSNGTLEPSTLNNDNNSNSVKQSVMKSKDNVKVSSSTAVESVVTKSAVIVPRTMANGVSYGEKPAKPEKPERRPNSRELIEKQRNWTSHFSKTRSSPR